MSDPNLERILAVVRRELGATEVLVESEGETPGRGSDPDGARTLSRSLPDGRRLVVRFDAPPTDRAARAAQLDLLVDSFAGTLRGHRASAPPSPGRLLRDELASLCEAARARAAGVIDAHSPILWVSSLSEEPTPVPDAADAAMGADAARFLARRLNLPAVDLDASPPEPSAAALLPRELCHELCVVPLQRQGDALVIAAADPGAHDVLARVERAAGVARVLPRVAPAAAVERAIDGLYGADPAAARAHLLDRAVTWARDLPELPELHRGALLRAHERGEDYSAVARSFASIYILVVAFDGAYDEVALERAFAHAMPTIERLVAALPPMDPAPGGAGVVALRAARRRR